MRLIHLFLLSLSLSCLSVNSMAQAWKKYANLCLNGDYSKAELLRSKAKPADSLHLGWNYSIAEFYLHRDHIRYNTDSAFLCNQRALKGFETISSDPKLVEKWKKSGIRLYLLQEQNRIIHQLAFDTAQSTNTIAAYEHFLSHYSDSTLQLKARELRNELAFQQAKNSMDFNSFQEFLNKYPDARQWTEARDLYERLLFEKTTQNKTWQSFLDYLTKYPQGPYTETARKEYLRRKLEDAYQGNVQTIYSYILEEVSSPYVFEAADSIIKRSLSKGTSDEYLQIAVRYPLLPRVKEVWLQFYRLETADDELETYIKFIRKFPQFPLPEVFNKDTGLAMKDFMAFEENGKWGFLLDSFKITDPLYDEALAFSGRLAAVSWSCTKASCLYGYVNKQFKMQIPPRFIEAEDFDAGFAIVSDSTCENGSCKFGVINENGDYVLMPEYESVSRSGHGFWIVEKAKRYQYISHTGSSLIAQNFRKARKFNRGIAAVAQDSGWFFIDTTGKKLHDGYFRLVSDFTGGIAQASPDGSLWGYMLPNGTWLSEPVWRMASPFENGRARVSREEKVMKKGKEVYELKSYDLLDSGTLVPLD